MAEREAVIVGAVRTPIGKFLGGLSSLSATELGAIAIREAVRRSGVPIDQIDGSVVCNDYDGPWAAASVCPECFADHARLISIHDRPGWAWWDGDDPRDGQWIPVKIDTFLKQRAQQRTPHA